MKLLKIYHQAQTLPLIDQVDDVASHTVRRRQSTASNELTGSVGT